MQNPTAPTPEDWAAAIARLTASDQALDVWLDAWEKSPADLTGEAVVGVVGLLRAHQEQLFILLAFVGASVRAEGS